MSIMEAEINTHWKFKLSKKLAIYSLLALIVAVLLFGLMIPAVNDHNNRTKIVELILVMSSARVEIDNAIKINNGKLPIDPKFINHDMKIGKYRDMVADNGEEVFIEYFDINQNGKISLLASGLNVYIELTPVLENGEVIQWQCYGSLQKMMPSMCRNEKLITSS